MILGLFRRSANETVISRLYTAIVAASRQPALYRDLEIPDTFEGRFESLTLHAVLVLRRLKACEAPGPDMAQHLVDMVFQHFDRTLREMGVGDTVVPKRMKGLAEAFLGRSVAYDEALRVDPTALASSIRRNVYRDAGSAERLTAYTIAAASAFEAKPLQAFIEGAIAFPEPSAYLPEAAS